MIIPDVFCTRGAFSCQQRDCRAISANTTRVSCQKLKRFHRGVFSDVKSGKGMLFGPLDEALENIKSVILERLDTESEEKLMLCVIERIITVQPYAKDARRQFGRRFHAHSNAGFAKVSET